MTTIADIRKEYRLQTLDEGSIEKDAIKQFSRWWGDAVNSNIDEMNALTLATAGKDGRPSARIVLLKGYDDEGFVFFTNYESDKGKELAENPYASMVFYWKELERQVRIQGKTGKITPDESDIYFRSRPVGSRIGAWASPQSRVISSRETLEADAKKFQDQFENKEIARPPHWGGYRLYPQTIEFWQGRPNRLHDRFLYTRKNRGWRIERLAP